MHKSQDLMCALAFVVDLNGNDNRDGTKTYIGIMKNKKEETRKKKARFRRESIAAFSSASKHPKQGKVVVKKNLVDRRCIQLYTKKERKNETKETERKPAR